MQDETLPPGEGRALIHREIDHILDSAQAFAFRHRRGTRVIGERNGFLERELTSKGAFLLAYDLEENDG